MGGASGDKKDKKARKSLAKSIVFRHIRTFRQPQAIIEALLGVLACYKKRRINYLMSIWYHFFYSVRVALSIRASKCDIVLVYNFLQFASIIKLFNPSAKICLSMHCEWLTQFSTRGQRAATAQSRFDHRL